MIITKKVLVTSLAAAFAFSLSACGGGGSGSGASGSSGILPPPVVKPAVQQKLGLTVKAGSGNKLPFAGRANAASAASQPVTVTYNGAQVASGTLDSNGFVELTFTQDVPAGATVTVTVGSGSSAIVASVTLATAITATATEVVYNAGPPPTITVASSADNNGDGQVDPTDSQQQTETENPTSGEPENVNSGNNPVLPSNLPITVATCGSTLTLAPASGFSGLGIHFHEKVEDTDTNSEFEYQSATFNGPLTFPMLSTAARIELSITQNGNEIFTLEAPLGAITGGGSASPSPSPSASASPVPSPAACPTLSPPSNG